ncbi:ribosomal protein S5 domain 2-type protein [Cercophora newfieldiana]|uniref:Small ribosomal subunit protein uS9m n=1 Tax=Cercophora newfieldiana TaxID=92897 RepID=A0AA40CUD8_9PEZI|nr:ribosomal protein S5 domain 2-type protein [Cercophora newfieldiana]
MASSSRQAVTAAFRGACRSSRGQWQPLNQQFQALRIQDSVPGATRCISTEIEQPTDYNSIRAAAEIDLTPGASAVERLANARPVPVSPSYFTRMPKFNDRFLALERLARTYGNLPRIPNSHVQHVAWQTLEDMKLSLGERIKSTEFARCLALVKKLHTIHPKLKPRAVKEALQPFKKEVQPFKVEKKEVGVDKYGRAHAAGKRKSSVALAWLVEGTGEVLINSKTLPEYFGRVHDRESALWALHSTDRLGKYNVWARVSGGGTTGQAEALTLAIAKALMVHEPALKPALRRAGCVTRDPRKVERKKAGHVKARKSPTWVKR